VNVGPWLARLGGSVCFGLTARQLLGEFASHGGRARGIETVPEPTDQFETLSTERESTGTARQVMSECMPEDRHTCATPVGPPALGGNIIRALALSSRAKRWICTSSASLTKLQHQDDYPFSVSRNPRRPACHASQ
jgi:hypothetical protein